MKELNQKEVLEYCILNKISFAIYKLPDTEKNILLIGKEVKELKHLDSFSKDEEGFIISPFSHRNGWPTLLMPVLLEVESTLSYDILCQLKSCSNGSAELENILHYADYTSYCEQFNKLHKYIENGIVRKAILSRIKHVPGLSVDLASEFYYKLSEKYGNAYTFMFYTPQSGLWSGASPELLLERNGEMAKTVSLAGTRKSKSIQNDWREKELDEQQIVTDFVTSVLDKYRVEGIQVRGPYTVAAGKVSHLKTFYKFDAESLGDKLWEFVNDLHPTPAVCGLPKAEAINVVLASEKHRRSYYAGYLGRLKKEELALFVNIRSLKFVNDAVDLYLGGGITLDSKAEEEWEETEMKSTTLMDVIEDVVKEFRI